jgi:hypothetical protein
MFFGTYSASMHLRVAVLMEGFADHGDEVSEVNVPLGLDTADRVRILKRPWLLPILVVRLVSAWCAWSGGYADGGSRRRTRSSSATSAISTCCWPGGCSAGRRSRSTI